MQETVSDGDFEDDLDSKINIKLGDIVQKRPSFFERNNYLRSIFPSLKV